MDSNYIGSLRLTEKQDEAIALISANKVSLLEGGARSGKTVAILGAMLIRAMRYPESWHVGLRLRRAHVESSIWKQSMPKLLRLTGWGEYFKLNHDDMSLTNIANGSVVLFDGLDDAERVEKILGKEYATIFINEGSQISYDSIETVMTRLNPPKDVPPKFIYDWNPPSMSHWGYKLFHQRKFPNGLPVPDGDYGWMKINPVDNKDNISDTLFQTLSQLSGNKRKRFLEGEYTTTEGALWKREIIKYQPAPEDLVRVVVGVDPSGSKDGDEIGIIVSGLDNKGFYYVLDDYSFHGTPKEWSDEVVRAYNIHKADLVCAEKNYGGDMVEAVITQFGANAVNVKMVSASRGKMVRAEPISALYEKGLVFHAREFTALEDELCTYKGQEQEVSPNRLDSLVWSLTELSGEGAGLQYVC